MSKRLSLFVLCSCLHLGLRWLGCLLLVVSVGGTLILRNDATSVVLIEGRSCLASRSHDQVNQPMKKKRPKPGVVSFGYILPTVVTTLEQRDVHRLIALAKIIRGGGSNDEDENKSDYSDKDEISPEHVKISHCQASFRRGTRTTGAGASKRRNPSIFSQEAKFLSSTAGSQRWTAAALAGDVLNRRSDSELNNCMNIRMKNKNVGKLTSSNPMAGRLLAKQSKSGTLILKFPAVTSGEIPTYVELSEANQTSNSSGIKVEDSLSHTTISAQFITNVEKSETEDDLSFVSLEGIYGVYNLPCSGPHLVLIVESEEVYTSPPSVTTLKHDESNSPLIALRRVKSMEIVPLRNKNKPPDSAFPSILSSDEQRSEEARQLRLLRNSFKEHDFYFTVPALPKSIDQSKFPVVQDVTHCLQRSFLEWAAHYQDQSNNTCHKITHRWWIPYIESESNSSFRRRVVDPRFFWNEQTALGLLEPILNNKDEKNRGSEISNEELIAESPYGAIMDHVIPVTSAFVGVQRHVPIPSSSSSLGESYDQLLISRRSKYRTGTRFTRRGTDGTGAVANYAETEQICLVLNNVKPGSDSRGILKEVYSHVQTRGSIPLHWSSPADVKAYRPRVFIGVDPVLQARGLRDHLLSELWWYSSSIGVKNQFISKSILAKKPETEEVKLAMVNLIDKHGDQGRLGSTFDSVLSAVLDVYGKSKPKHKSKFRRSSKSNTQPVLTPSSVAHIWYDFHAECKGGRWDRLNHLLEEVTPTLNKHGYFCAVPKSRHRANDASWELVSLQDGIVRTNCMDCLDRTNVVQSMFGRHILYRQLHQRVGLSRSMKQDSLGHGIMSTTLGRRGRTLPLECTAGYKQRPLALPWSEGEAAHRLLWADNADAISRLYAGTPALKGDFTRTGKRTKRGALDDGLNSLQRYYLNNFIDADRQEGMDLLVGNTEFNLVPLECDETSRVFLRQELSNDRRGYNESHVRIKVKRNEQSDEASKGRKLTLSWLPGDLRHHMQSQAILPRSPLSSAAKEERLDAKTSSDFLLEVASSAADYEFSEKRQSEAIEILQSIDHRSASSRPWWYFGDDGYDGILSIGDAPLQKNIGSVKSSSHNVSGYFNNRAFVVSILFLLKAPMLSAGIIVGFLASGFI
ncbi:hypothetical protein ACHAXS_002668 [Conticribra weissflogii]